MRRDAQAVQKRERNAVQHRAPAGGAFPQELVWLMQQGPKRLDGHARNRFAVEAKPVVAQVAALHGEHVAVCKSAGCCCVIGAHVHKQL